MAFVSAAGSNATAVADHVVTWISHWLARRADLRERPVGVVGFGQTGRRVAARVRALGLALALWLVAAVLWDGLLLLVAMGFGNRPIEVPLLVLLGLNPIDLTRVLLLLGTDAAALLGYTGALAQRVLGDAAGRAVLGVLLTGWLVVPLVAARRAFVRKDF